MRVPVGTVITSAGFCLREHADGMWWNMKAARIPLILCLSSTLSWTALADLRVGGPPSNKEVRMAHQRSIVEMWAMVWITTFDPDIRSHSLRQLPVESLMKTMAENRNILENAKRIPVIAYSRRCIINAWGDHGSCEMPNKFYPAWEPLRYTLAKTSSH
jgi:hypothetical protein